MTSTADTLLTSKPEAVSPTPETSPEDDRKQDRSPIESDLPEVSNDPSSSSPPPLLPQPGDQTELCTPQKPSIGPKPRVAPRLSKMQSAGKDSSEDPEPTRPAMYLDVGGQTPSPAINPSPQQMTFSAKKNFFEKEVQSQAQDAVPRPEKRFAFLSSDEVARMKLEEEEKFGTMTEEEFNSHVGERLTESTVCNEQPSPAADVTDVSQAVQRPRMMTAKAERRQRVRDGGASSGENEKLQLEMSPAEWRALQAEKRAAWRQARLKSLEQDALQAQIVIRKMSELIEAPEPTADTSCDSDGWPVPATSLPANSTSSSAGSNQADHGSNEQSVLPDS